jgi:hypothetical protein
MANAESKSVEGGHQPRTAFGSPFDDMDADIILRSSDQVDFLVYKVILSKSSPVFKTMFSLPQPVTVIKQDSRSIIDLAETSKILEVLLSVIYPHTLMTANPLSLDDAIATLNATRKYEMDTASRRIMDSTYVDVLQSRPVEAFCAAFSCGLREAAQVAAKASLKHRLDLDDIGENLYFTNGPALLELWRFHRACSTAAAKAVADHELRWITLEQATWWSGHACQNCDRDRLLLGSYRYVHVHISWSDYIDRAHDALRKHPCSEAVTQPEIIEPSYLAKMCDKCRKEICYLWEFSRYLGKEVERLVSEVRGAHTLILISPANSVLVEVPLSLPF